MEELPRLTIAACIVQLRLLFGCLDLLDGLPLACIVLIQRAPEIPRRVLHMPSSLSCQRQFQLRLAVFRSACVDVALSRLPRKSTIDHLLEQVRDRRLHEAHLLDFFLSKAEVLDVDKDLHGLPAFLDVFRLDPEFRPLIDRTDRWLPRPPLELGKGVVRLPRRSEQSSPFLGRVANLPGTLPAHADLVQPHGWIGSAGVQRLKFQWSEVATQLIDVRSDFWVHRRCQRPVVIFDFRDE